MPSETVAGAFLNLAGLAGAPWRWAGWQNITGLEGEPWEAETAPAAWTPDIVTKVSTFVKNYLSISPKNTSGRMSYMASSAKGKRTAGLDHSSDTVGRTTWSKWITDQLKVWNIATIVDGILVDMDRDAYTALALYGEVSVNTVLRCL